MRINMFKIFIVVAMCSLLTACPKNKKTSKIIKSIPTDVTFDEKALPEGSAQDLEKFLPIASELSELVSIEDLIFSSVYDLSSLRSNVATAPIVSSLKVNCWRNPMTQSGDLPRSERPGATEHIHYTDYLSGTKCPAKMSKSQQLNAKILESKDGVQVLYSFAKLETGANYLNPDHQKILGFSSLNRETNWQIRTEVRGDGKYQYGVATSSGSIQLLKLGRAEFQINEKLLQTPKGDKKSVTSLKLTVGGHTYPFTIINHGEKIYLGRTLFNEGTLSPFNLFRIGNLERDEILKLSNFSALKK